MDNKKDYYKAFTCIALLAISATAWAKEPIATQEELEKPPAVDEGAEPLSKLDQQADITIIRKKTQTIEEYRINGRLYKVKVIPKFGPPYYLLYPEGSGLSLGEELEGTQTPYWNIFRW